MNLKETSDKKLVDDSIDIELNKDYPQYRIELLSRLARGRKAIDAMGKAINCRETFLKSEMSVLGDLDMAADNFASSIHKIMEGYQQSCKEATDE